MNQPSSLIVLLGLLLSPSVSHASGQAPPQNWETHRAQLHAQVERCLDTLSESHIRSLGLDYSRGKSLKAALVAPRTWARILARRLSRRRDVPKIADHIDYIVHLHNLESGVAQLFLQLGWSADGVGEERARDWLDGIHREHMSLLDVVAGYEEFVTTAAAAADNALRDCRKNRSETK